MGSGPGHRREQPKLLHQGYEFPEVASPSSTVRARPKAGWAWIVPFQAVFPRYVVLMSLFVLAGWTAIAVPESRAGLRLVLRADRAAYALGEPVELTLAVTNPGPDPVTVTAPSSQLYDFTVFKDGTEVWRWSAGRMFLTVLTDLTIPPGETRALTEVWNQQDLGGRPVEPGEYVVVGALIGGEQVGLAPQRLHVTIR